MNQTIRFRFIFTRHGDKCERNTDRNSRVIIHSIFVINLYSTKRNHCITHILSLQFNLHIQSTSAVSHVTPITNWKKRKEKWETKVEKSGNKQNIEQERLTERAVINGIQTVQIPKQMELRNPTRA